MAIESTLMILKVLLPFRIFAEKKNVKRLVAETSEGSFGILPQRLDCVAALVSGILIYETEAEGEKYMAVNEGILVKAGLQVLVSVRNAFGEAPLGELRELIEKEQMDLDKNEIDVRFVIAKIESGFIRNFDKLRK